MDYDYLWEFRENSDHVVPFNKKRRSNMYPRSIDLVGWLVVEMCIIREVPNSTRVLMSFLVPKSCCAFFVNVNKHVDGLCVSVGPSSRRTYLIKRVSSGSAWQRKFTIILSLSGMAFFFMPIYCLHLMNRIFMFPIFLFILPARHCTLFPENGAHYRRKTVKLLSRSLQDIIFQCNFVIARLRMVRT